MTRAYSIDLRERVVAPKRDLGLLRRRRLKLFKKANLAGVPIGADWDPAYLAIPERLEVFSSDLMGPLFGAYPHPGWSAKCQHDNTLRLSFRAAERGPSSPKRSADAGSSPRAVDLSEPAKLDGAGGGNRTHTPFGTGF